MDDTLQGLHAAWTFGDDAVRIRYGGGWRVPKLFRELGLVVVPNEAIADVALLTGRWGTIALRLLLRPGSDPLLAAAAGQLSERDDPYRLLLPTPRETLAEYYADELRARIEPGGDALPRRFLLPGPLPPRRVRAYDGEGYFDGETVTFNWTLSATRRKQRAGTQRFHVSRIEGVEWAGPNGPRNSGFVRLRVAGWPREPILPENDLAALTIGFGQGSTATSLPFAAAVLARVRAGTASALPSGDEDPDGTGRALPAPAPGTGDPDEIVRRIRKLGELRDAGLLTDEEFAAKKSELLRRL